MRRAGRIRRSSGSSFVGDNLLQALDAVFGEGGYAVLADAVDVQAAVLGEHVDREVVQPVLILAELLGDVANREDGGYGSHGQAARVTDALAERQLRGRSSSSPWTRCSAMRASTSASQACGSMSLILAVRNTGAGFHALKHACCTLMLLGRVHPGDVAEGAGTSE